MYKHLFSSKFFSKIFLVIAGIFIVWLVVGGKNAVFSQESATSEMQVNLNSQGDNSETTLMPLFDYQGQLLDSNGVPVTNPAMPMKFRLYNGLGQCWEEDRTGVNAVDVDNGRFQVLLGQIISIPTECFQNGDLQLEMEVNGETLSPRELLTSVADTVRAQTLIPGATTQGDLAMGGTLDLSGQDIINADTIFYSANNVIASTPSKLYFLADEEVFAVFLDKNGNQGGEKFELIKNGVDYNDPNHQVMFRVDQNGRISWPDVSGGIDDDLDMNGHTITNVDGIQSFTTSDNPNMIIQNPGGNIRLISERRIHLFIDSDNDATDDFLALYSNTGSVTSPIFQVDEAGNTSLAGDLSIGGSCNLTAATGGQPIAWRADEERCSAGSISSGAYIEVNLQTPQERAEGGNPNFSQGDLLCWGEQYLELCSTANSNLVIAVADSRGRPLVLGAEPIKVIGPVEKGDYLVASSVPGYAVAAEHPAFGIVIAQALADFHGESGLVWAMIRKM